MSVPGKNSILSTVLLSCGAGEGGGGAGDGIAGGGGEFGSKSGGSCWRGDRRSGLGLVTRCFRLNGISSSDEELWVRVRAGIFDIFTILTLIGPVYHM